MVDEFIDIDAQSFLSYRQKTGIATDLRGSSCDSIAPWHAQANLAIGET